MQREGFLAAAGRRARRDLPFFLLAGAVFAFDQLTKAIVRSSLALGESWPSDDWLVKITHVTNTGAAFGLFQEGGGIFTILAIAVAIMIIYYFPRIQRGDWALRLAMGLQLGGAVGNLIDRLQHGYVTDFISVSSFPVFNVADTSITLGVVILLLSIWLGGDPEEARPGPVEENLASD